MINQPQLFDLDATAQRHSPTSVAAAVAIAPHLPAARKRVLEYLRSCPNGSTDNQGIAAGVVSANGYRARRVELVRAGLVRDSGRVVDGSVVWEATK